MKEIRFRLFCAALDRGIASENPAKWDISGDAVRCCLATAWTHQICLFMRSEDFLYRLPQHVKDAIASLARAREDYNECVAEVAEFVV